MKKLLIGLSAASLVLGAMADGRGDLKEDCDLATYSYSGDYSYWRVLMEGATPHIFTLSADMSSPSFDSFEVATYSPSVVASGTIDLQNHTMQPNWKDFFLRAWASGDDAASAPVSTLTVKNGTIEGRGQSSSDTFYVGNFGQLTGQKGQVVLDNINITNYNALALGLEMQDSSILFKDSCLSAHWIAHYQRDNHNESNCTITYQDTTVDTPENFYSDFTVGDTTLDLHRKLVYTGSKTRVHTGDNFLIGYGMPHFEIDVLDGATFISHASYYIGFLATGTHGKMVLDHATLTHENWGTMMVGYRAGNYNISCNESDIDMNELYVGYDSSDNTMVATNCDFSSLDFIRVGGTSVNSDAPQNNKLYIYGQDTKFHANRFAFEFYGANGLVVLDDVTANIPGWELDFYPINNKNTAAPWEGNEIVFQNGANVTLGDIFMGKVLEADKLCTRQSLTVKGGSTLNVNAMLIGGYYNTLTIDDSTVQSRSSNLLWLGRTAGVVSSETQVGNTLVFKGDHPKLRGTASEPEVYVDSRSVFRFVLPENGTYADTPIVTCMFKGLPTFSSADSNYMKFEFPNLAEVRKNIVGTKEIELIRATGWMHMVQDSEENEAALLTYINSQLPAGCTLHYSADGWWTPKSLCLTIEGQKTDLGDGFSAVTLDDGSCTITGSGALSETAAQALKAQGITSLVLDAGVTGVDASAFAKFYGLSSVTFKDTGSVSVGDNAFLRCNSLESLVFEGAAPALSDKAFTLQTAIYMKDGLPTIYTIPQVTIRGYTQVLYGSNDLKTWTKITTEAEKPQYHFFRTALEQN